MDEMNDKKSLANDTLFDRVAAILEEARGNVVRAVNSNMVIAYWLIGREIVQELQGGEERAAYGKKVIEDLSARLNERYGRGYSVTNLWYFRQFYLAYADRSQIPHPSGGEFADTGKLSPTGRELAPSQIPHPSGTELQTFFSPQLSWSHYRALMRVENAAARDFYEREAIACGWSKTQLERQIHSFYYTRISSRFPATTLPLACCYVLTKAKRSPSTRS